MKHFAKFLTLIATLSFVACAPKASDIFDGLTPPPPPDRKSSEGFSEMETALAGNYRLKTFDNRDFSNKYIPAKIEIDTKSVRDAANTTNIRMLNMPLFHMANSETGTTGSLDLGPLEGLGEYASTTVGDVVTYTYKFNGPIHYEYQAITLILDLSVKVSKVNGVKTLDVSYTAEIPGHVGNTVRTFTLTQ